MIRIAGDSLNFRERLHNGQQIDGMVCWVLHASGHICRLLVLIKSLGTDDVAHLNKMIGKWMPEGSKVAVDSHPRLSGIMDTINSTLAHGPETRLPKEFYDNKGRAIIDKIGVEEWFSGYQESREYRMLGIGGLMGDVVCKPQMSNKYLANSNFR